MRRGHTSRYNRKSYRRQKTGEAAVGVAGLLTVAAVGVGGYFLYRHFYPAPSTPAVASTTQLPPAGA